MMLNSKYLKVITCLVSGHTFYLKCIKNEKGCKFVTYREEKNKKETQDFRILQWSLLCMCVFFLTEFSPLYGLFCKLSQCNSFHP